jgi:hypothetical protein
MEKLKVGEKYLSIMLAGHNPVSAFKNKDKKKDSEPDYKGNGVAVWINTKQESKVKVSESDL